MTTAASLEVLPTYFYPSRSDQPDGVWLKPLIIHDQAGVADSTPGPPDNDYVSR